MRILVAIPAPKHALDAIAVATIRRKANRFMSSATTNSSIEIADASAATKSNT